MVESGFSPKHENIRIIQMREMKNEREERGKHPDKGGGEVVVRIFRG